MCGVCLPLRKLTPFSVVLHVSWYWFWARGSGRELDTVRNLWSALLLHVQVFGVFSHQDVREEPGQRVFVLPSVYLVSVLSVYIDISVIKMQGVQGEKLDVCPKLRNTLFAFVTTFMSGKAVKAVESLLALHYVHFSLFICAEKRH